MKQYNAQIIFTRSFNHSGPGQSEEYVFSNFAKQCVEIGFGLREPEIHTGNLEVERDFLDVRDVVRAYEALIKKGNPGKIYNVCSGHSYKLQNLLGKLTSLVSYNDITICKDEKLIRQNDPLIIRGDNHRLTQEIGWEPSYTINSTLADLYAYWLYRLTKRPT